ncbi:hypothetical protein EST38_g3996 [Candolleomyces aberdarensis]|uniref:Phosphatase n=1 Tax=Candolleomyces aberdarensis TaxID=2316362 RepID=A0A4Q2DQX4_9AGAR|nr:hypothetical protein EST38_g3996 [Candolleomyces aberdarensis]
MKLDPGFKQFYQWCKDHDVPFIIVSRQAIFYNSNRRLSHTISICDFTLRLLLCSGMAPLIRAILSALIGEEDASQIEIIANDVTLFDDGKWDIKYRHPSRYVPCAALGQGQLSRTHIHPSGTANSGFGHDKSQAILPYRRLEKPPTIFFLGDGVSDISAARWADVLFAKQKPNGENDLATYCTREGIKHLEISDFSQAIPVLASIVNGEKSVAEVMA